MKNKGLSVLLSFVLVLVLTVSFSVPVMASSVSSGLSEPGLIEHSERHSMYNLNTSSFDYKLSTYEFDGDYDPDLYYEVFYDFELNIDTSVLTKLRNTSLRCIFTGGKTVILSYFYNSELSSDYILSHYFDDSSSFIIKGSNLNSADFRLVSTLLSSESVSSVNIDTSLNFSFTSIVPLSSSDSADYKAGYNAGYTAGEESGYSSGYSSGYDDGVNSVDQDAIYDQGYQAGADSVDTQSYYDAGYNAGYSAGQSEGYELGYESGYNDAMERFASWGADTSEYPKLISENSKSDVILGVTVKGSTPVQYSTFYSWTNSADFNPSHTYCFYVDLSPLSYTGSNIYFLEEDIYFLNVGGIKYKLSDFDNAEVNKFFIPGDRISSAYSFSWEPYCAIYGNTMESANGYVHFDLNYSIYDYGPSGDTQNHIANQTDQLTNGYDSSSITSSNNALSGSIAEFTGAESQITDQSFGFIDQVQFYDLNMQPQLLACITFCSSWLQSLFVNIGDWGILVMVSLSLGFGLMLIGWFKYRRK